MRGVRNKPGFVQFGAMERRQLGLEIDRLGETGLDINKLEKRYTLKSLKGISAGCSSRR